MKDFLENTLRQNVDIEEHSSLYEKLPLAYRGKYTIFKVKTNGLSWAAISPKKSIGLVTLRKDRARIEKEANVNCALFFEKTTYYIKEKLLDEGIPFVVLGKQVYLPFLGYLLANSNERDIAPVHLISYLTQKLLLSAIYDRWQEVTVSEAALRLKVTKMSASRCFDELEYLGIDVLGMKGKSRIICIPADIRSLWNRLKTILRNPVIFRYELREDIKLNKTAGLSALCAYSLLSDNEYPTYAVTKKELKEINLKERKQVSPGEKIGCVVLELGYFINFDDKGAEDPLSVVLSLTEKEREDERVRLSIKEMLEEHVWLKG